MQHEQHEQHEQYDAGGEGGGDAGPGSGSDRWWPVLAGGLAVFMVQLDVTIVNVALPNIEDDLGTRVVVTQWVVLGYLLPLIGLSLGAGRWIDVADPRRALGLAATGFAATSVAAGAAPGIAWLVAARAGQGVCAVVLLALAPVLATQAIRPQARARAIGIIMLLGPLGGMTGPAVGGQLVETVGWRWIFYVNVPMAAAVLAAGARQLPVGTRLPWPRRSWLVEALTFGGAAVALLVGLSLGADVSAGWLLVGLLAVPLLLGWCATAAARTVRRVVAAPGVLAPHVGLGLSYTALFTILFLVPFFLQRTLDVPPGTTGWALLAFPAAVAVVGLPAGVVADRVGARPVALGGALAMLTGLVLLVPLDRAAAVGDVAWRLALVGAGFGLFNGQTQVVAMGNAPATHLGMIGGTTTLIRQLGAALGATLGAAFWSGARGGADAGADGLRQGAMLGAVLAVGVVGAVAAEWRRRRTRARHSGPGPDPVPPVERLADSVPS